MGHLPMKTLGNKIRIARVTTALPARYGFAETALLQGDGLAERTVRILPHVTPSPRVPAASKQSGSVSFISDYSPGNGVPASYPSNGRRVSGVHGSNSASRHSFPKSTCSQPVPFTRLHSASYPSNGRGACVRCHEQSASRHCSPKVPAAYLPRRPSPGTHSSFYLAAAPRHEGTAKRTGLAQPSAPRLAPSLPT